MPLAARWNQRGRVIVMSETTDEPLTLAGACAGTCWGADTKDHEKNFKRGLECLRNGHGKALEYAQIYMILSGWSARVIRELYTHQSGQPTKLQASTRYVDYSNFDYIVPPFIQSNEVALDTYDSIMQNIGAAAQYLENDLEIKREDVGMILPLGMETKVVYRTNLRALMDMAKVRMCSRAYWEYRQLMKEILDALAIYSDEWKFLVEEEKVFKPKCEWNGYCDERYTCGRKIGKEEFDKYKKLADYCYLNGIKIEEIDNMTIELALRK